MRKSEIIILCVIFAVLIIVGTTCVGRYVYLKSNETAGESAADFSESPSIDIETEPQTEVETKIETETESESEVLSGTGKIVVLDPGHQSFEVDMSDLEPIGPGSSEMKRKASTGPAGKYTGVPEYELVLNIGLALRDELESRGYEVHMTREDNMTAISNKERAELASNVGADILLRIHADGNDDTSVNGAMTMVPSAGNPYVSYLHEDSYVLGEKIINAYCEQTGFKNNGVQLFDNMSGINWSTVPVTIIEMGFMSNESDDRRMQTPEIQEKMVLGMAEGIDAYFAFMESKDADGDTGREVSGQSEETPNQDLPESGNDQKDQSPFSNKETIRNEIQSLISSSTYNDEIWSVCVAVQGCSEQMTIHNQQMKAASLIKLYIMGAVYEAYDTLTGQYGRSHIDQLLEAMITISDNDAANTLTGYLGSGDQALGRDAVNRFCSANGYAESSMGRMLLEQNPKGENYTSVTDCVKFLQDIEASVYIHSDDMVNLLKRQQRTGKIPSGVPSGVVTANKTGELTDVENDAAIVYANGSAYFMCVMSQNLAAPAEARNTIVKMSEKVYEYLKSK